MFWNKSVFWTSTPIQLPKFHITTQKRAIFTSSINMLPELCTSTLEKNRDANLVGEERYQNPVL